jgi:glycosyltransferase involved in cell wall biosynthesis
MVSDQFYKDVPSQEKVGEIIHRRECPETAQLPSRPPKYTEDAYIISVSTLEPRKNYRLLLQAWALACQRLETRPVLVLVANLGWRNQEDVQELTPQLKSGRVAHVTRVAQHELRALYSGAHAVVCPSRSEGFDLSGVEAMLCDTPVIASDIDVHRWVYGNAAAYFNAYDVSSCADAMVRVLSTPKETGYLADLRRRGLERAKLYTPEAIGPQWAELFQRLAGGCAARSAERIGVSA